MKRWIAMLFAAWMLCTLTFAAFADGRGPAFSSYTVVCDKETTYFEENWDHDDRVTMDEAGSLPAGTKLSVGYEYEAGGVLYGSVRLGKSEDDYRFVFIRLSDVRFINERYTPKKDEKLSRTYSVFVTAKDGIMMYTGPNEQYEPLTRIPHGTTLTYTYGNDQDSSFRTWAYVNYRSESGWIYVYGNDMQNGVAEMPRDDEDAVLWAIQEGTPVYSGTSFANIRDMVEDAETENLSQEVLQQKADRVIGSLEAGKKYPYLYRHNFGYSGTWYCLRYGLRTGWIFLNREGNNVAVNAAKEIDATITFRPSSITLWKQPDYNADKVQLVIPKNTTLDPTFSILTDEGSFYYLTVQGQTGWCNYAGLFDDKAQTTEAFAFDANHTVNRSGKRVPIYSDIMQKDAVLGSIPAGAKFTSMYHGDYYVEAAESDVSEWMAFEYVRYNGVTGWVDLNDLESPDAEETTAETETATEDYEAAQTEESQTLDETAPQDAETAEATVETASASRSLSASQMVLYSVVAAAVLTLTAIVTLALIRRKRTLRHAADDETKEIR